MSSEFISNLVKKAKNGSAEAFGELYEVYATELYRFAYYYMGSTAAAEDCVSEAVCLAFQNLQNLRKNESFKPWMFRILRNCCKNAHRIQFVEKDNIELSEAVGLASPCSDIAENLSLINALQTLSEEEKEIMILYFSSGYTSKEIADFLGLKDTTVRSKISRAAAKMREMLVV